MDRALSDVDGLGQKRRCKSLKLTGLTVTSLYRCTPIRKLRVLAKTNTSSHCSAVKIGIKPWPSRSGRSAFPSTDPNALNGSVALMAWPGVSDVVGRSPTSMGA